MPEHVLRPALIALLLLGGAAVETSSAQSWRTMTSARQVTDQEPISVEVQYGAGSLRISPAKHPTLYRMELRYDEERARPLADYDAEERVVRLGVESEGRRRRRGGEGTATIELTPELPLDLQLHFGAGRAELELGGMTLRNLSIATGASESEIVFREPNRIPAEQIVIEAGAADLRVLGLGNTRAERIRFEGGVGATLLDFSGSRQGELKVEVKMGLGSITLRVPRSSGVRLERSSFLTSFTAPDFERRGESYFSRNWESAPNRLVIEISAALGAVEIEWIE